MHTSKRGIVHIGATLALVVVVLLSSCSLKKSTFHLETDTTYNGALLQGTTKNLTNSKISYIKLTFRLRDRNNLPVGAPVSVENKSGIPAKGSWDFRVAASAVGAVNTTLEKTEAR